MQRERAVAAEEQRSAPGTRALLALVEDERCDQADCEHSFADSEDGASLLVFVLGEDEVTG